MDIVLAQILALEYISFSDVQEMTWRFDGTIGQTIKLAEGLSLSSHSELLAHSIVGKGS